MGPTKLVCNPANAELIRKSVDRIEHNPDMHIIYGMEIVENPNVPAKELQETGKVIWYDTDLVKYSDGPASDMTEQEYIDMCVFFGWAEKEVTEQLVYYRIGDRVKYDQYAFKDMVGMDYDLTVFKDGDLDSMMDKIAASIEHQIMEAPYPWRIST